MNESLNNDDALKEKYRAAFNHLKVEIEKQCSDSEILIRLIEGELTSKDKNILKEHLDICPTCDEIVLNLQNYEKQDYEVVLPANWNAIEHEMDERIYQHLDSIKGRKAVTEVISEGIYAKILISVEQWFNRIFRPLNFAYAGLIISLCLGGTYTFALLKRPAYFSITLVQPQKAGTVRGERIGSESLQVGLESFEQGNYEMAIKSFNEYLKSHPSDYFANFHLGLVYLLDGKESLLGLPYRYNSAHIQKGISYLNSAFVNTRNNAYYQEDCLWFLGKAYIMLGEMPKAKQQFEKLISMNQSNLMRKATAKEMIIMIEEYISK